MRRLLSFLAKAAISALLLYLSLRRVNLDTIGQRLSELDWRWVGAVIVTMAVQIGFNALRWRDIADVCGAKLRALTAFGYTFIGQFFSQVLPSTVGGDAVRMWLLARGGDGWPTAIYSVLIDRVVGVAALALLVAICLPWTLILVQDPVARAALVVIGFGALAAAVVFLCLGAPNLTIMERWWPTRHLAAASRLAWKLCRSPVAWRVAAIAISVHLLTVLSAWATARAVHASIDIVQTLFVVLPVILVSTIPISIAGWGVRESAMVMAFSYAGLAEGDGLIVSILYGATTLAIGAVGGIVWAASGYKWSSVKTAEADTLAHERSP
ncbi:MAG: hypothetical protein JWR80_5871 [Bradyrhizobium sp.]|nr:hypothetical protein [Bradyrhizobium sp.]